MITPNLELLPNWLQPGNAGDSGGPSSKPPGTGLFIPGSPGTAYAAPAYAYNNFYFYQVLGGQPALMTYLEQAITFTFQTKAALNACQALEFELHLGVGGMDYNCAWQVDFVGNRGWNVFDYPLSVSNPTSTNLWVPSGIPLDPALFAPSVPVVLRSCFRRTPTSTTHLGLFINGRWTPLNFTRPPTPMTVIVPDYVHFAFQLDAVAGSPPPAYRVEVGGMSMTTLADI